MHLFSWGAAVHPSRFATESSIPARPHVPPHRPYPQRPPASRPVPGRGGIAAAVGVAGAGQTQARRGARTVARGRPQRAAALGFLTQPTGRAVAYTRRQSQHLTPGA